MVQGRVRKCRACDKCHLLGCAVGRQMAAAPGGGGGGDVVGVV